MHAKRVLSLANGVIWAMHAAAISVHAIGLGMANALGADARHTTKQIDRLLSNGGLDLETLQHAWIRHVVGERRGLVVALDWTDFEADDHTTCALSLVTAHGRATALCWKTILKSELAGQRAAVEDEVIERFDAALPEDGNLTLLADRAFGEQGRYLHLAALGWDWVIRFRGNILVERVSDGETRKAKDWVHPTGRAQLFRDAWVTADRLAVAVVVTVKQKGMKEPWLLCSSHRDKTASELVTLYGQRFTIEESFRDLKNEHFGLGLSATHIGRTDRRDRLLMVASLAHAFLTLLGAASERSGLDRTMVSSTKRGRVYSLFNQGLFWYRGLPNLKPERLRTLMNGVCLPC